MTSVRPAEPEELARLLDATREGRVQRVRADELARHLGLPEPAPTAPAPEPRKSERGFRKDPDALERGPPLPLPDPCTEALLDCARFPNFPMATLVLALLMYFCFYTIDGARSFTAPVPLPPEFLPNLVFYAFAHASADHLLGNLGGLLLFGIPLEILSGPWTLLAVFFAAALLGALAEVLLMVGAALWVGEGCTGLLGSSGGVMGLVGGLLGYLALNWQESFAGIEPACGRGSGLAARCVLLLLGLVYVSADIPPLLQGGGRVAHAAHLFGALAGLVTGLVAAHNVVVRRGERAAQALAALGLLAALAVLGALLFAQMARWADAGVERECFR